VQPCLRRPVASTAFADLGFPHSCFSHSCDSWDEHLLLLLHGLGDCDTNFATFGAKLQLPQTASLAIRAPLPLLDMGFTWFDVITAAGDVCLDSPDAVASLRDTSRAMCLLVQRLHSQHSYPLRNIFVLGYSQGGTVALGTLQSLNAVAIGGVISISGAPPPAPHAMQPSTTPVLFTLGQRDACAASKSRAWAQFELQWRDGLPVAPHGPVPSASERDCCMLLVAGKAEAMVHSADETRALMEFFGRHLKLRSLQLCACRFGTEMRCCVSRRCRYAQADVVGVDDASAAAQVMGAMAGSVQR
jgi:predicted esterase